MIDVAVHYWNFLWIPKGRGMGRHGRFMCWLELKFKSDVLFMCWLDIKFESDGVDRNCQEIWKTTKTVCYECIHLLVVLLLCCCPNLLHSPCCAEPIAILLFIYLTHWCVEVNICIQEGHLGTLQFVIQGFGTKEQTFSISKPTSQVKKQCFAVIATYISSAEAIFVDESCSCRYDFNKLHFTFKCEGYTWRISMQCLMHFVSVLDKHPLSKG